MIIIEVLLFIFSTRNVTREIIQCIFAVAKPRRTIFKSSNSIQINRMQKLLSEPSKV